MTDDGKPLQSMAHPIMIGLNESSIVETTIRLDPNTITKQAFYVVGTREIEGPPFGAMAGLITAACDWFAWMPADIWKWRHEPSVECQTDFETGKTQVRFVARGFFNVDVRLGDHTPIVKEL